MVKTRWWVRTTILVATLVALAGCGRPNEAGAGEDASAEQMPELSVQQAGEIISDAMLITSQALYLAIAGTGESREVATDDRALVLSWSEEANFLTGVGRYELELDDYAIPENDPFSEHYHGYVFTGTIVLESPTGADTAIAFELDASHPSPDDYPGERVVLNLGGASEADTDAPGTVLVNGREFSFEELSASF
ncbi:MAG: hypothetical protein ACOC1U_05040 [Spirochaetota bacterium]